MNFFRCVLKKPHLVGTLDNFSFKRLTRDAPFRINVLWIETLPVTMENKIDPQRRHLVLLCPKYPSSTR